VREKVAKMPRGERVKRESSTYDNSQFFPFLLNKSVCPKFVVDVKRSFYSFCYSAICIENNPRCLFKKSFIQKCKFKKVSF
jgi:hypothetical protein